MFLRPSWNLRYWLYTCSILGALSQHQHKYSTRWFPWTATTVKRKLMETIASTFLQWEQWTTAKRMLKRNYQRPQTTIQPQAPTTKIISTKTQQNTPLRTPTRRHSNPSSQTTLTAAVPILQTEKPTESIVQLRNRAKMTVFPLTNIDTMVSSVRGVTTTSTQRECPTEYDLGWIDVQQTYPRLVPASPSWGQRLQRTCWLVRTHLQVMPAVKVLRPARTKVMFTRPNRHFANWTMSSGVTNPTWIPTMDPWKRSSMPCWIQIFRFCFHPHRLPQRRLEAVRIKGARYETEWRNGTGSWRRPPMEISKRGKAWKKFQSKKILSDFIC